MPKKGWKSVLIKEEFFNNIVVRFSEEYNIPKSEVMHQALLLYERENEPEEDYELPYRGLD